jgi:hypothetical protein
VTYTGRRLFKKRAPEDGDVAGWMYQKRFPFRIPYIQ